MNYTTIEAQIHEGQITVKEPARLPKEGRALLILLPLDSINSFQGARNRVQLPLIAGDGANLINPSLEQLDASLWD